MPSVRFWILFFLPFWAQGQIVHQPLDGVLSVSGELAELRNHHFHSGIDLRTGAVTGKNVYAVADGWVRRIVIRPDGYGWALYVDHPSGHTSVYAHLESFSPELWAYVLQEAERRNAYRLDLYPAKGSLPVVGGQVIAQSGNSGASGGPHLHFEMRDRESEEILDPIAMGLRIPLPQARPELWAKQDGRWRKIGDSASVNNWYDLALTLPEQGFEVEVSDSLRSIWSLRKWTFDVQRGADAGLALDLHRQQGIRGFHIHPSPTQPAPGWKLKQAWPKSGGTYSLAVNSGGSPIWAGRVHVAQPNPGSAQPLRIISNGDWSLELPAGCFAMEQNISLISNGAKISAKPDVAAIKPVTYSWAAIQLADSLWDKTYLSVHDGRGSAKIPGLRSADGRILFTSKTCGSAEVRIDTKGPQCELLRRDPNGRVWISVQDELDSEIVEITLNGTWIWGHLDLKSNSMYADAGSTKGKLVVRVRDEVGNLTNFTTVL